MKRTTLFVALASAFSLSAFAGGQEHQSGAQSQSEQSSASQQQSASSQQSQSPEVVKQVQQKLSEAGQDVGQPDGKLGPKTQAALKEFQEKNGLQASGQLDEQTFAALNIEQSGSSSATGGSASPSQGSGASGAGGPDTSSSGASAGGTGSSGPSSNDIGSGASGSSSSDSGSSGSTK
jgi:peptidoglycan hydrolase-like protein with peptidoglycan-binding domain